MTDNAEANSFKKIRNIYGLRTEEIAEFLGVSKSAVQKYESGHRDIPKDIVKKLAKGQIWTIDQIMYGEIPDIDLSQLEKSALCNIVRSMFRVYYSDRYHENIDFLIAVMQHKAIRRLFSPHYFTDKNMFEIITDLRECKERYRLAMRDNYFKPFAIANLISISVFYAALIDVKNGPDNNLLNFSLNKRFGAEAKDIALFREGVDFAQYNEELHSKSVCKRLWEYIEYLKTHEDFKEIADFLSCLLVSFNFSYALNDEILCKETAGDMLWRLVDEGNPYAIMLGRKIASAYHIEI